MNGHRIKIGIGTLLLIVGGIITWYVNTQAGIDKEQNIQIEKRIRIPRYNIDQQIMREWLKRIEGKLDRVLK